MVSDELRARSPIDSLADAEGAVVVRASRASAQRVYDACKEMAMSDEPLHLGPEVMMFIADWRHGEDQGKLKVYDHGAHRPPTEAEHEAWHQARRGEGE